MGRWWILLVRKVKYNIDVIVQVDTRERDLDYLKTIKIDQRRNKDGQKIVGLERCCVKPNTENSTGDISFKYKFEGEDEWIQASFAIERKGGMDFFSSIYTKVNRDRLEAEMKRAVDGKVDIYFVVTDDLSTLNKKIQKVKMFNENACITFFGNMLRFNEFLMGYNIPLITSGADLGWIIRRLVKKHIKENKLNYK